MLRFGSLKTRIVVLTTVPLSALFLAILIGTIHTANEAIRGNVERSLSEAGSVFVQLVTTQRNELLTMARVTVRDPRFFATFTIPENERGQEFGPTLQGITTDFLRITEADFLEVFDAGGNFLSYIDRDGNAKPPGSGPYGTKALEEAMKGYAVTDYYRIQDHIAVAAVVPVFVSQRLEAVVRLGSYLDTGFANEVKRLTGADVCFIHDGQVLTTTLAEGLGDFDFASAPSVSPALSQNSVTLSDAFTISQGEVAYLSIRVRLNGVDSDDGFDTFIARGLAAEFALLVSFEQKMAVAGTLAIVVTLLTGFYLGNSITRPLSNVVEAAAALKTGDYDYPLDVRGGDEVAYLGKSFDEMRQSLQTYVEHLKNIDQVKSNFIAVAGHELRTPLTVITGFNELIVSGALGEVPDKIRETTQHIQEQLTALNGLVQKILDLSSFEQDLLELDLREIDLRQVLLCAVEKRKDAISGRKLNLACKMPEDEVLVSGDFGRLEQALLNLIDNAIRFTRDGGSISVALTTAEDKAHLTVRDTGIGIPANELKWIFQKLYEVGDVLHHSSGRHQFGSRGFGLGLALAKALVDKHEGELLVKSTLGHGSEFTIVLRTLIKAKTEALLAGKS